MGKSYRRLNKQPKRSRTRRRRGGANGDAPKSSYSMSDMSKHLNKAYESGVNAAKPHVEKINKIAQDLHKKSSNDGKKAYSTFKYRGPPPSYFDFSKSGKSAYSTASKAMLPHDYKMSSSMGSSMGFSSLSSNNPNVKELAHAQQASARGVPTAYSQTSETSAL